MRKLLLTLIALALFAPQGKSQKIIAYSEDFDGATVNVTTGSSGNPPRTWDTTSFLATSLNNSFHVQGSRTGTQTAFVWFETPDFSTVGYPYVFLDFYQIAKVFANNFCRIEVSTNQGTSWTTINASPYYKGNSPLYSSGTPPNNYFNEASYTQFNLWNGTPFTSGWDAPASTPQQSWWVQEKFDLTGLASNITNPGNPPTIVGYPNVRIRFIADFPQTLPPTPSGPRDFLPGWFIDDIVITKSACELEPPVVNVNYIPVPCFNNKPEGSLEGRNDSLYKIGVQVTDVGGFNTGVDSVNLYYSINRGPLDSIKMNYTSGVEYQQSISGIGVGDSVAWFIKAVDLACAAAPNFAQQPEPFYNATSDTAFRGYYVFWIDSALPAKCGNPSCNAFPTVVNNYPWITSFELSNEWTAGTGNGSSGTTHRGVMPLNLDGYWSLSPSLSSGFGWSVRSGPTGTQYTGPNGDHTSGAGKYLYSEASTTAGSGNFTTITTPCINLTKAPGCLGFEFFYHMFGSDVTYLAVDIDTGANTSVWWPNYHVINGEQQSSDTDPWERAVFSLDPFVGKFIRVRFRVRKSTTGDRNDIAIDDFKIFEPDSVDMIVISNTTPTFGLCSYSNEDVDITVLNNGCRSASAIPVAFQLNGGIVQWDTIKPNPPLMLGDTLTYTFTPKAAFPTFGTYQLDLWTNMAGDVNRSNDSTQGPQIIYQQPITSFPFFEDFENGAFLTQNLGNSNFEFTSGLNPVFRWQVGDEMTATRNTGPYDGYHNGGQYLYAESNSSSGVVSTYMRTMCLDFTGMTNPVLDFFYHAYGADISKLEIEISLGNEDLDTWSTIPGSTVNKGGGTNQNKELSQWEMKRINLSAHANTSIKLRFKVTRDAAGDLTNFAIDKIRIFDAQTNDAGGYSINRPLYRGTLAQALDPKVRIANFGTSMLTSATVNYRITPLCGVNQGIATIYTQAFTGLTISPGANAEVTLNSANVVHPAGEFELAVYVTSPNGSADAHAWNDTIKKNVIGRTTYHAYDNFSQNFDPCDYDESGFIPNSGLLQWELGSPQNNGSINLPRSSPNCWSTNINGRYLVGTTEILRAPLIDEFDTIWGAELRFAQNLDLGLGIGGATSNAAASITYRTGGTFKVLGENFQGSNVGSNWHGGCLGTPSSALFGGKPAFVENTLSFGSNQCINGGMLNGWVFTSFPLFEFNSQVGSQLEMQFEFRSAASKPQGTAGGGWAIDDFSIYIPPQNSASPISVKTVSPIPFPGVDQEMTITVQNTGAKNLYSCNIDLYIDNIKINTSPFTYQFRRNGAGLDTFLAPGFKETIKDWNYVWPAAMVTSGPHNVCVVTSRPNVKRDNLPTDDSLCLTITIIDEIDLTAGSPDSSYCDDFENPNDYSWFSLNSDDFSQRTSWEEGTPSQFGGAFSGNNAWVTDADSNYLSADASSLFTPIFIVDSGQTFSIDFEHNLKTEKYHDGGNVEYTLDGGVSWYPIGYALKDTAGNFTDWYNTEFVTSLDQIRGGWTDSTDGWQHAHQRIMFLDDTKVILRFRFGSDYLIESAGWAIDDFCFAKTDTTPQIQIGNEEYVQPEQMVVGSLAPNPTNDISTLGLYLPQSKTVNVVVYDMVGKLIETRSTFLEQGLQEIEFNGQAWSNGVYFINIKYEGEVVSRKLVKR